MFANRCTISSDRPKLDLARGKRVGIVHLEPNIDSVPCLCSLVELLVESGFCVDLFTRQHRDFRDPIFPSSAVRVHTPQPRKQRGGIHRLLPRWLSYPLLIRQWHQHAPFTCFLGVDPRGLFEAHRLARWIDVQIGYLSLELLLVGEADSNVPWIIGDEFTYNRSLEGKSEVWLKNIERQLLRDTNFVLIQDSDRAQLLVDDNQLDRNKILLFPNAPLGPVRAQRGSYWHRRFNLPPHTRVALHSGSIGRWTGVEGIVKAVNTWPPNWVFVVHTRYVAGGQAREDVDNLRHLGDPNRVFFSFDPVSRQEYDELVDSADLGIAFYLCDNRSRFTQTNIKVLGLSSGKLSFYLRSGLPIIINKEPTISRMLAEAQCGVAVENAEQVGAAISQIECNYGAFRARAFQFFVAHLDCKAAFTNILARIA